MEKNVMLMGQISLCFAHFLLLVVVSSSLSANKTFAQDEKKMEVDRVATKLNPVEGAPIPKTAFHNATFSPDGKWLAVGRGTGELMLWDLEKNLLAHKIQAHKTWTFAIHFDKAGERMFTAGGDNLVKVWKFNEYDKPTQTLTNHTGDVHGIVLTKDEQQLISAGDDKAPLIWDMKTGRVAQKLEKHPRQIPALAISPDGSRLVTASRDSNLRIFDLDDGEKRGSLVSTIEKHEKDIISVRYSPDGTSIAAGDYAGNVGIWDADMEYAKWFQKCTEGSIVCVDFSPDGKTVAAVDDNSLHLITFAEEEQKPEKIALEKEEKEQFSFVRYHPTQNKLAVTTTHARVLIYDLETKKTTSLVLKEEPKKDSKKKSAK